MIQLTQGLYDCAQPIDDMLPGEPTATPGSELCPTAISLETFTANPDGPTTAIFVVLVIFLCLLMTLAKRRKMI